MVLATLPLKSHHDREANAGVEDDVVEGVEDLREHVGVDLGVDVQGPLEHPGQAEVQHSDRREQDVAESGIMSVVCSSRTIRDNLALKRLLPHGQKYQQVIERISHFMCWQNQDGNEIPDVSKTADDDLRENQFIARYGRGDQHHGEPLHPQGASVRRGPGVIPLLVSAELTGKMKYLNILLDIYIRDTLHFIFHVGPDPRATGHEWQTMIPGCEVKYELSFYLGSIVKDGNGVTIVTTCNYDVEPKYLLELFSTHETHTHCSHSYYTWSCQRAASQLCNCQQVPPPSSQYSGKISDRKNVSFIFWRHEKHFDSQLYHLAVITNCFINNLSRLHSYFYMFKSYKLSQWNEKWNCSVNVKGIEYILIISILYNILHITVWIDEMCIYNFLMLKSKQRIGKETQEQLFLLPQYFRNHITLIFGSRSLLHDCAFTHKSCRRNTIKIRMFQNGLKSRYSFYSLMHALCGFWVEELKSR